MCKINSNEIINTHDQEQQQQQHLNGSNELLIKNLIKLNNKNLINDHQIKLLSSSSSNGVGANGNGIHHYNHINTPTATTAATTTITSSNINSSSTTTLTYRQPTETINNNSISKSTMTNSDNKMRILIFSESFYPYTSGISRRLIEIIKRLIRNGFRIHVVTGMAVCVHFISS